MVGQRPTDTERSRRSIKMDWHRSYSRVPGYAPIIGPAPDGLKLLSFGMLCLEPGESYAGNSGQSEMGIVIISGICSATAGAKTFDGVGERDGFFDGLASALYIPPGTDYRISGLTEVQAAVGSVPAPSGGDITLVRPSMIHTTVYGEGLTRREVPFVIYDQVPASRLIVGETIHTPGGWSGYPPHKHDQDKMPAESANEEVYVIQIDPPQGFALLRVYDHQDLNEVYTVSHNDAVAVPRGYHPMVGAPGYKAGFIWFMAGEKRPWKPVLDPDHAWLA